MPFETENTPRKRGLRGSMLCLALAAATLAGVAFSPRAEASDAPFPSAEEKAKIDHLIVFYSKRYGVPVSLSREVVRSESEYRALARNGPYWGLMQIRYDTAKSMGYDGAPVGLLDAETNLAFGIAYLANAYKVSGGNLSRGHMLYRTGYYYEARRKRVLDEMITVDDFAPVGQSPAVIAAANEPETGELWSGDVADVQLGDGMAPLPRQKPGEAATVVATAAPAAATVAAPVVVEASVLGVAASGMPIPKPRPVLVADADEESAPVAAPAMVMASVAGQSKPVPVLRTVPQKSLAELRALAAASAGSDAATPAVATAAASPGPVVARPTVVYASVLPLSHAQPFEAPALAPTAPASPAAAAINDEVATADDAGAAVPLPRPRPKMVAAAEADGEAVAAPASAPIVVASVASPAAAVPLPRPRPLVATP